MTATASLRPMPADRRAIWLEYAAQHYIGSRMEAGETRAEAQANSDASYAKYFPNGEPADGQHLFDVVAGTAADTENALPVGFLWIGVMDATSRAWWVFDIEIDDAERGRGYGRAAMQLAESESARLGAATLGLNVFGFNTVARHLYESLGYETTAVQMKKPVD